MHTIREAPITQLPRLAAIDMRFTIDAVVTVAPDGSGGFALSERPVRPSVKDYDALPGNHPDDWMRDLDVRGWGLFFALDGDQRIGGALIAAGTAALSLTGGLDVACLWDLRVAPAHRGQGVGAALLRAAAAWARDRGCVRMSIETQDNNAAACRFYRRQGCTLERVDPAAYPALPGETALYWALDITGLSEPPEQPLS